MKKIINGAPHVLHNHFLPDNNAEKNVSASDRSAAFLATMRTRRSVRYFSDKPVERDVIENLIATAASAPSGANKQPWTFCAVQDPTVKNAIKIAAEQEEYESYNGRMPEQWLKDLQPFGTDWHKPFLETAPWLIIVFAQTTGENKEKHYYVQESVGIACGFLIAAIHQAGLCTLTHTPSPMNFLKKILNRPDNERPFLLLPVGYPADPLYVPDIEKKNLNEVAVFL